MNDSMLKNILYFCLASIGIGLFGTLIENDFLSFLYDIGVSLFLLTGIYLLLRNGSYIRSIEYKLTTFSIGCILIGTMFKIMHWPFSFYFLAFGMVSVVLFYLSFMARKQRLNWVNWMKLLFLLFFIAGRIFILLHWPYHDELTFLSLLILAFLVVLHLWKQKLLKISK